MLTSAATIELVARTLEERAVERVVVDPVRFLFIDFSRNFGLLLIPRL